MDEKKTGYRTYPEEFKLEALELLKSSGKTARQIERDLGITSGLLVKWRDRYQVISKEAEQAHLALSDMEAAKRGIKRLQRRLAEVEEEREILHLPWRAVPGKKTINIFSRKNG
jgi:transposase